MSRPLKLTLQLLVSGGVIAFLLWRIDLSQTVDIIRSSHWGYVSRPRSRSSLATTWLMAWRWDVLLAAKGIHEPLAWLVRMYFVGYAAGQILPTAVGGDAVRIIEHSRRRPGAKATAAGAVVMERVLGSAGTLVLVAVGLAVAAGRYDDVRFLFVIELVFVAAMIVLGLLLFSRRLGRGARAPALPPRPAHPARAAARSVYWALHEYRLDPGRRSLAVLG